MALYACPSCGSNDLIALEVSECDDDTLYECEDCGEQVRQDELD